MELLGPIFIFTFIIIYLLGCIGFAFILWLIYKFLLKTEERPSFWNLYKISFSSGLIAGALGYALIKIATVAAIFGTATGRGADMALLSVITQTLNYPKATAALYLIGILAVSALLIYAGFYLAHRYHAKSTPKQIASKVSLIVTAALLVIQGAYFTYAWVAAAKGMEEAYGHLSPEEAAAAEAARNCALQMQQALTLPPEEQEAAIAAATNCMIEARGADSVNSTLPTQLLASWGDAYGQCMGAAQMGRESDPSCDRLDEIENQLTAQGYCYVSDDGSRSDWGWRPCEENSSSQNNQTVAVQTSVISDDNCREQGQPFSSALENSCGGTWNIYASIGDGYTWFSNANDRESMNINAQAERMREELRRCGIESYISLSDNFDEFTQDLVVVHSAPHSSNRVAEAELSRARACGLQGYSKDSRYQVKVGH
jgi:hypothetical protein